MVKSKMSLRRQELGLSQIALARLLQEAGQTNMTESRICRIETGRAVITPEERCAIANILKIRAFELFI